MLNKWREKISTNIRSRSSKYWEATESNSDVLNDKFN
jgi:hypothetical protein